MTTKCVKDMLDNIRRYHILLAERYNELSCSSQQPDNVLQIMIYLRDREKAQAEKLAKELNHSNYDGVLNTWLKESPEEPDGNLKQEIEKQIPNVTHDKYSLLKACTFQHHTIEQVYKQLYEIMPSESAKDYFENLLVAEDKELKNKVSRILEFDMM